MLPFTESWLQWTQTLLPLALLLKTHPGTNNLISDNLNYSEGTVKCRFWYCWHFLSLCDYHESIEFPAWYSLKPHWWFQRSLCAGVWIDFNARRCWKVLLSWTGWRTAETGDKFYPFSWRRYWTHCIEWTNVVGCSWQIWCCWKECVKTDSFVQHQFINQSYPSAQISVPRFAILRLYSNSWQWHF